jgi:hypothetical protein
MNAQRPAASEQAEPALMAQVADEYRQRGYEVALEPRAGDLPPSLGGLRPDLVAVRDDDRVAVVVKRRRGSFALPAIPDMDALRREGWRMELFFADDPAPPVASPDAISARLREAEQLADDQHRVAALLLVWVAAEETLRTLASRFAPGETGRKILTPDQAYSIGLLSANQHRSLSILRGLRNQAAHNITPIQIPDNTIRDAVSLLERMTSPVYVPPPVMADRVFSQFQPNQDVHEQVQQLFPHADPLDQADAAEYIRTLKLGNEA